VGSTANPCLVQLRRDIASPPFARREVVRQPTTGLERSVSAGVSTTPIEAPRDLVRLGPVMERGTGRPEVVIGLIDGPVAMGHPALSGGNLREISGLGASCIARNNAACFHGTFVAGILSAERGAQAPALCPSCTLIVRPIFSEAYSASLQVPSATTQDLAAAVVDCIQAGARILNLSAALGHASPRDERHLQVALDYACRRGVIVVAAAGNQGSIGGSTITRHPWVIPVVGYSLSGRPMTQSTFGAAIGRHGLGGPGEGVTSLSPTGPSVTFAGTSVAAPFVSGTFGLLLSAFPHATGVDVRLALTRSAASRRRTVVPPLLDAWTAYRELSRAHSRTSTHRGGGNGWKGDRQ